MSGSNPTGAGPSKAIGNLAKKPDASKGAAPKLKFVPTLPARRKKEEIKPELTPTAPPEASTSDRGRGRGRGRGEGRGRGDGTRGRGRGARPVGPPTVEMVASGPFAMGPSAAGLTSTRGAPRPAFAAAPPRATMGGGHGTSLTPTMVKVEKRGGVEARQPDEDEETYSDQEDGVEIIDIQRVREMDWSAPEPLRKEKKREKKKDKKVKSEEDAKVKTEKSQEKMEVDDNEGTPVGDEADVDAANALNLSESEEEEEMEDLIEDFRARTDQDTFDANEERKLLLFQFPEPFPLFTGRPPTPPPEAAAVVPTADPKGKGKAPEKKGVSFAQGTKPGQPTKAPAEEAAPEEQEYYDGVIGQLEVHRSGAVKMRLANGIVMDVTAATQPSFLQQATHVDHKSRRLHVLGEVHRRFVVTPDLDVLLNEMARLDAGVDLDNPDLQMISMDE